MLLGCMQPDSSMDHGEAIHGGEKREGGIGTAVLQDYFVGLESEKSQVEKGVAVSGGSGEAGAGGALFLSLSRDSINDRSLTGETSPPSDIRLTVTDSEEEDGHEDKKERESPSVEIHGNKRENKQDKIGRGRVHKFCASPGHGEEGAKSERVSQQAQLLDQRSKDAVSRSSLRTETDSDEEVMEGRLFSYGDGHEAVLQQQIVDPSNREELESPGVAFFAFS